MDAELPPLPSLVGQKRYTIRSKINTFPGVLSVSETDRSTLVVEPLRPRWDTGQNLNVFGGGGWKSPAQVGTFGWGGGRVNELWSFEALR